MTTKEEKPTPAFNTTGTFIGRRITTKGTLSYFWILTGTDGKAGGYKTNLAPAQVGEVWKFHVDEKGSVHSRPRPEQSGVHPDADEVAKWEAEQALNVYEFNAIRTAKTLENRQSEFDALVAPLARMMHSLNSYDQRHAFANAVVSKLWKTPAPPRRRN